MKASKNPTTAQTVQVVEYVQTGQVVRSFEGSENDTDPDVLAREIVEALEAVLEQFREIVTDLGAEHVNPRETEETQLAS